MKTRRIAKAKLGADGKLRRVGAAGKSGSVLRGRVNSVAMNSPAAFTSDEDTPILTRRELRDLRPVSVDEGPDIPALRRKLRLSQGAFAVLFAIPLSTVKDWEQGRRSPDATARAYLRVIARNPKAVRHALEAAK